MKPSDILIFLILVIRSFTVSGQDIFRFERMGSEDGLSQNTAFSILFDSKGFMWIGTMNGLNRYDGYEFKIYRSSSENGNNFTNNRVTRLWEDKKGFIWMETYDGYYHFFNPESEVYTSLPNYEGSEVKNGAMQIFLQYSEDIILLGSTVSGLYFLKYDEAGKTYTIRQFPEESDSTPSDRVIKFLHRDSDGDLWVGTTNGVTFVPGSNMLNDNPTFTRLFDGSFTAVCETSEELWFGTVAEGILAYNKISKKDRKVKLSENPNNTSGRISQLYLTRNRKILAGIEGMGYLVTDSTGSWWKRIKFHSSKSWKYL